MYNQRFFEGWFFSLRVRPKGFLLEETPLVLPLAMARQGGGGAPGFRKKPAKTRLASTFPLVRLILRTTGVKFRIQDAHFVMRKMEKSKLVEKLLQLMDTNKGQ